MKNELDVDVVSGAAVNLDAKRLLEFPRLREDTSLRVTALGGAPESICNTGLKPWLPPLIPLQGFVTDFCQSINIPAYFLPRFEAKLGGPIYYRKQHPAKRGVKEPRLYLTQEESIQEAALIRGPGQVYPEFLVPFYEIAASPYFKTEQVHRWNEEEKRRNLGYVSRKANQSLQRQITDSILNMIGHVSSLGAERVLHYEGTDLSRMLTTLDEHFESRGKEAPCVAMSPRLFNELVLQAPEGLVLKNIRMDQDVPDHIGWFIREGNNNEDREMRIFFTSRLPNHHIFAMEEKSGICITVRNRMTVIGAENADYHGWIYYVDMGMFLPSAEAVATVVLESVPEIMAQ